MKSDKTIEILRKIDKWHKKCYDKIGKNLRSF